MEFQPQAFPRPLKPFPVGYIKGVPFPLSHLGPWIAARDGEGEGEAISPLRENEWMDERMNGLSPRQQTNTNIPKTYFPPNCDHVSSKGSGLNTGGQTVEQQELYILTIPAFMNMDFHEHSSDSKPQRKFRTSSILFPHP